MFWIVPGIDTVSTWIDHRVMVTPFAAAEDADQRYRARGCGCRAVLGGLGCRESRARSEELRSRHGLGCPDRAARHHRPDDAGGHPRRPVAIDDELQKVIDERTTPWGVTVQSVEIRDIVIPQDLEDAMSRQAQAERERQARVILGESEKQIAESFAEASKAYINNPTALHLRAMNMLFEGLKEKGALVIVPSSAVDTMNLGGVSGMVSLAQQNLPKEGKITGCIEPPLNRTP